MTTTAQPVPASCHRCGPSSKVIVTVDDAGYGFVAYCDNCSGGEYEVSFGSSKADAVQNWNEAVEDRTEGPL